MSDSRAQCARQPGSDLAAADDWPSVAVIIPVRNDASRLAVCLESLRRQNYPGDRFEIIVVDNGSTDESAAVARRHGATVYCHPGCRVGALRNRGVDQSHSEVLAFVDSDHEVPLNWLSSGVQALKQDREILAAGAPCLAPPGGTWIQRYWELHRLRRGGRRQVAWLGAGNMFVRRSDFDRAGAFREDLVAAEDVDLCMRLAGQRGQIVSDPAIENIHHGEPRTLWQFFRKEYWRGSSGVRAFVAQGCPWRELPSLLFPAYYLATTVGFVVSVGLAVWNRSPVPVMASTAAMLLPAVILASATSWQTRRAGAFVPLTALYVTYGLARAAAMFK